jgi:hypothetical protein
MYTLTTLKLTDHQSTRGWCYQEHALSPRCLVFTSSECFFTCDEGVWRESYHTNGEIRKGGLLRGFHRRYRRERRQPQSTLLVSTYNEQRVIYSLSHSKQSQSFPQYQEAVHDYTGRQLTYKTDVVAAFAGMLRTFCEGDVPYHGIPLSIFEHALCWSESEDSNRVAPGSRLYPRALAVSHKPASETEVRILSTQSSKIALVYRPADLRMTESDRLRTSVPDLVVGALVSACHLRRFNLLRIPRTVQL